jgi:hypothetical protein
MGGKGMKFRKVAPGLYERTDTPRHVEITKKFADAVRRESHSSLLKQIIGPGVPENDKRRT